MVEGADEMSALDLDDILAIADTQELITGKARAELSQLQAQAALVPVLVDALSASIEFMAFGATDNCQPYPLQQARAALVQAESVMKIKKLTNEILALNKEIENLQHVDMPERINKDDD